MGVIQEWIEQRKLQSCAVDHVSGSCPTVFSVATGAEAEFDTCLAEDPGDAVAANNKAICRMYGCNLVGAVHCLEAALHAQPLAFLQETVLLNLCSMCGSTRHPCCTPMDIRELNVPEGLYRMPKAQHTLDCFMRPAGMAHENP